MGVIWGWGKGYGYRESIQADFDSFNPLDSLVEIHYSLWMSEMNDVNV